jgi:DNA replication protein DnaC
MKEQITYYQKRLRLSRSVIEIYESIPFESKDQFMLDLLSALFKERRENVIAKNLKAAKFPTLKTFKDYSFDGIEFPELLSAEALKSVDFIDRQENLILYGGVGSGKTHMAIALGAAAIQKEKVVLFFTVHDLINQLVAAKETGQTERLMKKIMKADLILLDEWGYLPLHQDGARLLFDVISKCYEKRSLVLTTNLEFSHWKSFLYDEKLTVAIIDRVIHHSHLLFFNRPSYRKEHALLK